MPYFDFVVPTELPGVDPKILDPRDTYECACQWEEKSKRFGWTFHQELPLNLLVTKLRKALVAAGPETLIGEIRYIWKAVRFRTAFFCFCLCLSMRINAVCLKLFPIFAKTGVLTFKGGYGISSY